MSEPKKKGSMLAKLLKAFVLLFLVLVLTIVGVGMFVLDGKYEVERSVVINADSYDVHTQVGDLRQWPNWLPFTKHEPTIVVKVDKPTGAGAHQTWSGKDGKGELTFTSWDEDKGIEYDMVFDDKWKSKGKLLYEKSGEGTKVTWRMTGQNDDFMGKYFASLMPSMIGPMFEEGLADLKKKVEEKK